MVFHLGGGPPLTCVHVFDYHFEEDDISLEVAFGAFGTVKSAKKQTYVSNPNVFNGTWLVNIVLSGVLPRFLMVDGNLCLLWYRGQPLVCNLWALQGHKSVNCPNKDKFRKCGRTEHFARNCTSVKSARDSGDFPPLGSSTQAAEPRGSNDFSVSNDAVDSQLLKGNELDLVQSQSILQDLDPAGSSVEEGPISKTSKRARKDKGSSAKRSNFAPSSAVNICFTNSQEFNSLVTNSDELSTSGKENTESNAIHNISKDSSNKK